MEMNDRIYYRELACYQKLPEDMQRRQNEKYYDLSLLPTEMMREEFKQFLLERAEKISYNSIHKENIVYRQIGAFLQSCDQTINSFTEKDENEWLLLLKKWMLQEGKPLVENWNTKRETQLLKYMRKMIRFLQPEDTRKETEKDVWKLDKLEIQIRCEPTRKTKTLNFTKITPEGLRKEAQAVIYQHLQEKALNTVQMEVVALRHFSEYLKDRNIELKSYGEINRSLMEDYIQYRMVEKSLGTGNRSALQKLKGVLQTVGKIFNYPQLETIILQTDLPSNPRAEFQIYSDGELKRLNESLTRMDEQMARCLVIHQLLGTRISDTLTLKQDCLYQINGQNMIRIQQVKTHEYTKPVNQDVANLIKSAIAYTQNRYGETKYIFVDEIDYDRPMQYITLRYQFEKLIKRENLLDDNGQPFTLQTHKFRRNYGAKLTELNLDDWTIAKLLGHRSITNVKYYRKMSDQRLEEDTREFREEMSRIIYEIIANWEEPYAKLRETVKL